MEGTAKTTQVDNRYLHGIHPDQERLEKEAHDGLMEAARRIGERQAKRLNKAMLDAILSPTQD